MSYDFGDVDAERRRIMQSIGSEGTEPEERAAAALDALGVDYDAQPSYARYRPDFRLPDGSILQIHGSFWHAHPSVRNMDEVESNEEYWTQKQADNKARDRRRRQELLTDHKVPYIAWVWEADPVAEHVAWHCQRLGLVDDTEEHRFWSKVEKCGFDDCWEWQAGLDRGYGHYKWDGSTERAHRVAYELWYSDPGDSHILHHCDNRLCVNPRHLHAGTHGDNMREAFDRGMNHKGTDHGQSKLDPDAVRDIRSRHSPYGRNGTSANGLADEYNVSTGAIRAIIRRETWAHVEAEGQ